MTLNLHDGQDALGRSNLDRIIRLIDDEKPDIVSLQEVERNQLKTFEESGYHVVSGMNHNLFRYHFGNAVLTRHKIIYARHHYLPGNLEQRGLDEAAIDAGGTPFIVLNTHLGLGKTERERQFTEIWRIIGFLRGPILLTGDFNVESTDKLFSGFRPGFEEIGAIVPLSKSFPSGNPKERLDQIWFSPDWDIEKARTIPWYGSDHLPVIAELQLKDPEMHSFVPSQIPDPPVQPNPLLPNVDNPTGNVGVSIKTAGDTRTIEGSFTLPLQSNLSISAQSDSTRTIASLNYRLFVLDLRDFLSRWRIRGKGAWTISAATDSAGSTRMALEQYYRWSDRNGTKIRADLLDGKITGGIEQTILSSDQWGWTAAYDSNQELSFCVAYTPDKKQVYKVSWIREQNTPQWQGTWDYRF